MQTIGVLKTFEISFETLAKNHFSLLLKWLKAPHVSKWWDGEINWTLKLVNKKYSSYIDGYKIYNNEQTPIHAHIIYVSKTAMGYIQFYNAHDFPRADNLPLNDLSKSLGAIDIFIGDANYIRQGLGAEIIKLYLDNHVFKKFDACFVDPDTNNISGIRAYLKAGFQKIELQPSSKVVWMIKNSTLQQLINN